TGTAANGATQSEANPESVKNDTVASISQHASSTANQQANAGATAPASHNSTFTPEQLQILRTQIYAFKMLSKNMPLPSSLQQQLFPSKKQAAPVTNEGLATAGDDVDDARDSRDQQVVTEARKASFESFCSPYELFPRSITFHDHSQRSKRYRVP